MIKVEQLRTLCHDETIVFTQHLSLKCEQREIDYEAIKQTILTGEIIEQYPADYPYPSCLIYCLLESKKHLHTVVGLGDNRIWIVTAYYPDKREWESDYKTRKADI